MQEADVILVATRRSITHSAATVRARRGGARVGTHTPFVESYARCVGDADEIHAVGERLARALNDRARGGLLHVTTREGTYLRVPLGDRPFFNWAARIHDAGTVENVPGGEVINAPPEGRAEGRIHVNLKLPSWASATLPYDMEVREGRLVACPQDPLLIERYKARPDRDLLCEIAFGTSHLADRHGPCIMEVEKTLGTGHVAFGSNVSFGGANQSDVHMDFIFDRVTASLDGRTIIEDGKMCV
jgi:leucyl aminopeptidase (aminopeptidase T)